MARPALHALIFDLDGTLVDSRLDFAAMRAELDAPADMGLLEYIDALPSAQARADAMEVIHRHELAGARAASWMPGAEDVLHRLHASRTRVAIVTRNNRQAAELTMERLGMPPVPLKAREDAAPKPDPEALLAIAAQWRLEPTRCAYIGDFRYDIEAARRAGMLPVLYWTGCDAPPAYAHCARVISRFDILFDWLAAR